MTSDDSAQHAPIPIPFDSDPDSAGFFAAARRGELALKFCTSCGSLLHLPRAYCKACGSWDTEWREVNPTGRVHSWTVAEQQVHPSFPTPYTVVLVELDDHPEVRLVGYLADRPELTEGTQMRAVFRPGSPVPMPEWELTV